jgi:long-chain fatty acid transport protein
MKTDRANARLSLCAVVFLTLLCLPCAAVAGGFALYEYGSRANAMGGATIADGVDASTVAYNPAAMTQLKGTMFMGGATVIVPVANVRAGAQPEATTVTNYFFPPHAFVVHQASDKAWFGLGIFSRYGVGTQYADNWPGRTKVYNASLETYSINPNLALKLTDDLSLAFGVEALVSSADLRKKVNIGGTDYDMQMKVSGIGFGYNAALHYTFNEQLSAGLTYHGTQQHTDNGHARYSEHAVLQDAPMSISLTLPASYTLGVAYKPNKSWKLEADVIYTQWQDYEKLTYSYTKTPGVAGTPASDVISEKNWRNVWRLQFGGEYLATDWLALRAGFVWDQDPIRKGYEDYMLPSSDRKIYSTGFGVTQGPFTYDFAVMYLVNNHRSLDSNTNLSGASEITDSRAYMGSFSVGYKF